MSSEHDETDKPSEPVHGVFPDLGDIDLSEDYDDPVKNELQMLPAEELLQIARDESDPRHTAAREITRFSPKNITEKMRNLQWPGAPGGAAAAYMSRVPPQLAGGTTAGTGNLLKDLNKSVAEGQRRRAEEQKQRDDNLRAIADAVIATAETQAREEEENRRRDAHTKRMDRRNWVMQWAVLVAAIFAIVVPVVVLFLQ